MATRTVGDFVRYDASNGSIGKIVRVHQPASERYDVEWIYGLDVSGKTMTDVSCYLKDFELVSCTEAEYLAKANTDSGWSVEHDNTTNHTQ